MARTDKRFPFVMRALGARIDVYRPQGKKVVDGPANRITRRALIGDAVIFPRMRFPLLAIML
jgi:hypothetical protein